ncbi:Fe(3+) dicitrate ABC transporter substrate-binding protein [Pokkaliibacter sp. MBI-7]|uniref:Fe(3+) dicitrate ABC transporter substrate-binding protein n=1 Tax=Pokkaliibacter sp. MBI-7 TaxID=3040600 RepID=UPI00244AAF19|nr:Fe(3+) dicitrate ABC transporter substrate-binding protein [Pokkaliibacter sp. MBI-7]MDH2431454.1 Fe(3+) dicitrate ABC transporter substrate-binding protein [Pokkaliibacter sp. MBI-7]
MLFTLMLSTLLSSAPVLAVTVESAKGAFTLDYVPQRVVALENSFVDALAAVRVSPVGVADDNQPERLLPEVREATGPWQSVGTRSQPSLEVIASLKPDLIIADASRHAGVYAELQKIAPTLMLQSRRETYADNLKSAAIIGEVVGKKAEMQARLQQHQALMASYAAQLPQGRVVQFAVARENTLYLHTPDSYAGGVIQSLGLKVPAVGATDKQESRQVSLEQMLAINPEYLVVGTYVGNSIVQQWQTEPLWQALTAVQNQHVYTVDGNAWVRSLGILAAEHMGADLVRIFSQP